LIGTPITGKTLRYYTAVGDISNDDGAAVVWLLLVGLRDIVRRIDSGLAGPLSVQWLWYRLLDSYVIRLICLGGLRVWWISQQGSLFSRLDFRRQRSRWA